MKLKQSGFTLIEILVTISIIAILVIGGSQINFTRISDKTQLDIFNNSIVALFESIRNDALLGKGIGSSLEVPESWRISFTPTGITSHYLPTSGTWRIYDKSIPLPSLYTIDNFDCFQIDGSSGAEDVGNQDIIISGSHLSLSGACLPSDKIIKFDTTYKNNIKKTISINSLNGLIEIN